MGGTWIVSLEHMLDEEGNIAAPKGPARNLAKHIVSIVAMASRPEIIPLPEYQVRCRRRPGRKPCPGIIEADFDPEDYRIVWWCPVCDNCGYISNWQGSMWDLRNEGGLPKQKIGSSGGKSMTKSSDIDQIVQDILADMPLKERAAIANLDETDVPYLQYAFDTCIRSKLGKDDKMSKDVMYRICKVLQETHRVRRVK